MASTTAVPISAQAPSTSPAPATLRVSEAGLGRVLSLDTFRGLTMLLLISHGFGMYEAMKGNPAVPWFGRQFDHAEWVGCTLWDLIQPAFTFIVGAAMPFALGRRREQGSGRGELFLHVLWRAAVLILLSNVLSNWNSSNPPVLQLINVLCQIAFGYVICFLIMQLRFPGQVVAAFGILTLHAALFYVFPGPTGPFDPAGNIGAVLDRNLLGYNYSGYYTTINFLGNSVTILFGVWTGMLLKSHLTPQQRMTVLALWSGASFALGALLGLAIPMVKRLWTASFTFFSAGWVLLAVLALYYVVDVKGWKRWTFPAVVVGTNCIFIYSFSQVLRGWLSKGIGNFTGQFWFLGPYGQIPQSLLVTAGMWYLCYFLYQRKIFLRI